MSASLAPPVTRDADTVLAGLLALAPPGWAWNRSADGVLAQFLTPLAAEIARFERQAIAQLVEVDPRDATLLLADYEHVLGPDPCGEAGITLDDRRNLVFRRWTGRGGQSPAYFVALAAAMGIAITITEKRTSVWGRSVWGGERYAVTPAQFAWVITLPSARVVQSQWGGFAWGGGAYGQVEPSGLECPITAAAPAHTLPVYTYSS